MKHSFLTILLLFVLLGGAFAQELTVKSFEMVPMDLSASTNPRLDLNNQPCALVKVQLVDDISRVEGNVIGQVVNRGTEKWVYLTAGTKMMKIVPVRHLPLLITFADYGVKAVEGKVTYELTLAESQTIPEQQLKKQKLVINFQPASAMVLIDSKPYTGKGHVEVELPLGEHTYMIAATGYITAEGTVKLNGGNQRVLNETLEKETVNTMTQPATTQTQAIVPTESTTVATATSRVDSGHEWVDLGLSVCWATSNIGASSPGDYGDYYAWGVTTTKSDYSWSTYKYCNGSEKSMTKYCTKSDYGTVDNRKELDSDDDVAHVKWGGNWRMPTYEELKELKEKCKWKWTKQNGHKGYKVTGPNGNSIFLPAAGYRGNSSLKDVGSYGYYWSRTLYESSPNYAWRLYFLSGYIYADWGCYRCNGLSVRPVRFSE